MFMSAVPEGASAMLSSTAIRCPGCDPVAGAAEAAGLGSSGGRIGDVVFNGNPMPGMRSGGGGGGGGGSWRSGGSGGSSDGGFFGGILRGGFGGHGGSGGE
jgi:hypothetical protein